MRQRSETARTNRTLSQKKDVRLGEHSYKPDTLPDTLPGQPGQPGHKPQSHPDISEGYISSIYPRMSGGVVEDLESKPRLSDGLAPPPYLRSAVATAKKILPPGGQCLQNPGHDTRIPNRIHAPGSRRCRWAPARPSPSPGVDAAADRQGCEPSRSGRKVRLSRRYDFQNGTRSAPAQALRADRLPQRARGGFEGSWEGLNIPATDTRAVCQEMQ